jgi:hypothetical protein
LGVGGYALYYALNRSHLDREALLHGGLIGGTGLFLFCFWLRRAVSPVMGSAVFIAVISAAAYFVGEGLERERASDAASVVREQLFEVILPVCSLGTPLPDARGYVAGSPNPAVFFTQRVSGELYPSRHGLTAEFRPETLEALGVVVCAENKELVLQSCPYMTGDTERVLTRTQYVVNIRVVDPTTAEVLDTARLVGSIPAACPDTRSFGEYEYQATNYGSFPSELERIESVRSWLDGLETTGRTPGPESGGTSPAAVAPQHENVKPGDVPPAEVPSTGRKP